MLLLLLKGSKEAVNCSKSLNPKFLLLEPFTLLFGVALVDWAYGDWLDLLLLNLLQLFCDFMYAIDESDCRDFIDPILALICDPRAIVRSFLSLIFPYICFLWDALHFFMSLLTSSTCAFGISVWSGMGFIGLLLFDEFLDGEPTWDLKFWASLLFYFFWPFLRFSVDTS